MNGRSQLAGADEVETRNELDLVDIVEEILSIEIDSLQAMREPNRPFAGIARALTPDP